MADRRNDMQSKIILITGGSSGIGLATAINLSAQGAKIIVVAEKKDEILNALKTIAKKTNNIPDYYITDLSSQKEIYALAYAIKEKYDHIDVLINNAGGVFSTFQYTVDGLEKTIALNHFAPYLLSLLLLDVLSKSVEARIINVTSRSHYDGRINFDSFTKKQHITFKTWISDFMKARFSLKILYAFMGYFLMEAYAQSKLANVIFTIELAERLKEKNITVNSVHPGLVRTSIGRRETGIIYRSFWCITSWLVGIDAEQGAHTSVYLASAPELEGVTGKYFENDRIVAPATLALNKDLRELVMNKTKELIRL